MPGGTRAFAAVVAVLAFFALSTGTTAAADEAVSVSVEPSTDLVDGQVVTILVTGPSDAQVFGAQCRPEPLDCDVNGGNSTFISSKSDFTGSCRSRRPCAQFSTRRMVPSTARVRPRLACWASGPVRH